LARTPSDVSRLEVIEIKLAHFERSLQELGATPPSTAVVGQLYSFKPTAKDSSTRVLNFSIQNEPAWTTFNTSTGELAGTPITMDSGTRSNVVISVSDGSESAAMPSFSVHVLPQLSNGITIAWTPPSENTDGSSLTNLAGYRIHYGNDPSKPGQTIEIYSAEMSAFTITGLSPGTWHFAISALNSESIESNLSATLTMMI